MSVWEWCSLSLCVLVMLFSITNQQSNENSQNRLHLIRTKTSDESGYENPRIEYPVQQESLGSSVIIPIVQHEVHPQTLKNPNPISLAGTHEQDYNHNVNKYEDKFIQESKDSDLDGIIQQVFPQNNIQEYKTNLDNAYAETEPIKQAEDDYDRVLPRSPYKATVIKGGSQQHRTKNLKRKILLKRLKSPMYRSSQHNHNEQNSEELLHNILESIDQKDSENEVMKNAFLTKTTTYNISKLHENGKNKSFLIEKLVNYTTNINMLHSENTPTNYSDAHSSVLQTVLHLGQNDDNGDSYSYENRKPSDYSFDNDLSNDILGNRATGRSDNDKIFEKSPENHQVPTDFLGGQYLHPADRYTSKQTFRNSKGQVSSDFVGGQFIGSRDESGDPLESEHLTDKVLDFVGGQFVEKPLDLKINTSGSFNQDDQDATQTTEQTRYDYETSVTTDRKEQKMNVQPSNDKNQNEIQKRKETLDSLSRRTFDDGHNKASMAKSGRSKVVFPKDEKPKEEVVHTTTIDDNYTSDFSESAHQSSRKTVQDKSELGTNNIDIHPLSSSSEEVTNLEKKSFGGELLSTAIDNDFLSTESEEIVGNTRGILMSDPTTGELLTKKYNPNVFTTNNFDDTDFTTTLNSNFNGRSRAFNFEKDNDQVLGEASDIQQRKVGSTSVNTLAPYYLSSEEPFSQEQNATNYTDEVMLYAGKTTVSEELTEDQTTSSKELTEDKTTGNKELTEDQTTQSCETDSVGGDQYKIVNQDSVEENTTEICFPLSNKNNASLFDLLSGKLYLEKNGKKINLRLKGEPMKYCHSGTKVCRLYFDPKTNTEPSISEEILKDGKENEGENFKSNHIKRQISEEDSGAMKLEQNIKMITQWNSSESSQESEDKKKPLLENEDFIFVSVNPPETNKGGSDSNQTVKTEFKNPNSLKLSSEQSMLPVSYKELGVQNQQKPTSDDAQRITLPINGERITLHSLDSPYHKFGFGGSRLVRKIHHKRDSHGHVGGACGCNNPLLLSPSPVPDFRHFVGKRLAILKNIVHTVKDWAAQDSLRP